MHVIRTEQPGDIPAVRRVNGIAFETALEADLVDALRQRARPVISLVAAIEDEVIGHIMLSPVTLSSQPDARIMGLAPMAVVPERQRQGIGSELVRSGLEECRRLGFVAVVLIGHPAYYPRFGFLRASGFGLVSEFDVPDETFMALELTPGALLNPGTIRFHPAFAEAERTTGVNPS
jgi:putative acetyltransferase